MRTPRRRRPTLGDLEQLRQAHRICLGLMMKLRPATPEYQSLVRAYDALRTTAIDWTGDPDVWRSDDGLDVGRADRANPFVRRPDHDRWPT